MLLGLGSKRNIKPFFKKNNSAYQTENKIQTWSLNFFFFKDHRVKTLTRVLIPSPLYKSNTLPVVTCGTLEEKNTIWLTNGHTKCQQPKDQK